MAPKKKLKKKLKKKPSAAQDAPATHAVADAEDQREDQSYLENKIAPLMRSVHYDNSDPSKISWRVLATQIGLPNLRAARNVKMALQNKTCRKKLAEWLQDPTQVAAAFAANVVADMEVETLLRVPNGWHSSASEVLRGAIALNCDQIIMQAMEQKTQQGKEEIAFNVQVNKEQERVRQERERRKEAEKAELKWCRAEEKHRLKSAKFAELLTVDEALSFLWHNVGRDVLLVALNKLGGFGKACPFEMVIAVLHKAMQH